MAYRLYLDWLSLHQVITMRLALSRTGPQLLDVRKTFSGVGILSLCVFRAGCSLVYCKMTRPTKTSFSDSNKD